jgi:ABC-type nitrate/sulfonate/bicarbonate transport system ATPase subunit
MAETAIEVEAVAKRLRSTEALAGVSLAVERGQVLALLWPTGAGKTTQLRILIPARPRQRISSEARTRLGDEILLAVQPAAVFAPTRRARNLRETTPLHHATSIDPRRSTFGTRLTRLPGTDRRRLARRGCKGLVSLRGGL